LAIFGIVSLTSVFIYVYKINRTERQLELDMGYKVAIIVPCKGLIKNLEKNLISICEQNYPDYRVIFVLDSKKDPAFSLIQNVVKEKNNAVIEFSEKINEASGKISALISGIKKTGDVDVYVFADSDVTPHKNWLASLVTSLSDENVGATTGFRWFFPSNLKSSLISAWNMASMITLLHPISTFAWGGSTAIKKTFFKKLNIESKWKKGFSDDLILTEAVKKSGYKIKFVPNCVLESPIETDIKKFLDWGTQQITWVRWYYPLIWFIGCIGMLLSQVIIILGFILIFTGFMVPGIIMIALIIFEMFYGMTGFLVMKKLMCYPRYKFGSIIPYALLMPIVFILYSYNLLLSSFKQEIKWGGRYYSKKEALKSFNSNH
jgi:cellulose synthase/poly-beta-1,6-N-acetylglucosamine synthase-like glycosyltransferase